MKYVVYGIWGVAGYFALCVIANQKTAPVAANSNTRSIMTPMDTVIVRFQRETHDQMCNWSLLQPQLVAQHAIN